MIKTIDGAAFSRMMLSAAAEIDLNKQKVNELNVFPVPDGDTGTNMSMTLSACAARAATRVLSCRCCSAAFPSRSRVNSRPTARTLPLH